MSTTSSHFGDKAGQPPIGTLAGHLAGGGTPSSNTPPWLFIGLSVLIFALAAAGIATFVVPSRASKSLALPASDFAQVKDAVTAVNSDLDCYVDTNPALTEVQRMWCITLERRNDPTLSAQNEEDDIGLFATGCTPGLEVRMFGSTVRTDSLSSTLKFLLSRTCQGGGSPRMRIFSNSNMLITSTDPTLDATATTLLGAGATEATPTAPPTPPDATDSPASSTSPTESPAGGPLPTLNMCGDHGSSVTRPAAISFYGCAGTSDSIGDAVWTSWSAKEATATGTYVYVDWSNPHVSGADAPRIYFPVTLVLDQPVAKSCGTFFTRLTWTFTGKRPPKYPTTDSLTYASPC